MRITVFTPAYNRRHTLPRLYESLCRQEFCDFEWLIVDDGSTDGTEEIISEFENRAAFPIRYHKKENGGKHTAYNYAVDRAAGAYFFCVDSDDYLAPDALCALAGAVQKFPDAVGVIALKALPDGSILSSRMPDTAQVKSLFELNETYHCTGEFSIVLKTDVARQNPYPVFEGERFTAESVVYDRLGQYGRMTLLHQVITICEYQPDGYSANTDRLLRSNPAGYCLYFMQRIDLVEGLLKRLVMAGKYQCFGLLAGKQRTAYAGAHPVLTAACYPVGLLFLMYYKWCRGF